MTEVITVHFFNVLILIICLFHCILTEIMENDSNAEASRVLQVLNEEADLPPGSDHLGAK